MNVEQINTINQHVEIKKEMELSSEQKKTLGDVWTEMAVDGVKAPEDIITKSNEEIKKWLYSSVIEDTEKLFLELGLKTDQELINKINQAENPGDKAKLELEYIKNSHAQVDEIVKKFKTGDKSTKWDSWPKRMRETKEFNCVGATLIGNIFLEKAGIKSFYGNPTSHVVNIVKLKNGDWWYVDFLNGKQNIIKIKPEFMTINDTPTLKIDNPNIDYHLIPISNISETAGFVLGNLSSLQHDADSPDISDDNIEKIEAKRYLNQYGQNFQKADFSLLHETLYPKTIAVHESQEMKSEEARIRLLWKIEDSMRKYVNALSKEKQDILLEEMKGKKKQIEEFFGENRIISEGFSPELMEVLRLYGNNADKARGEYPEIYQESVDKFIERINCI
jgi:hypothetical protein